MRKKGHPTAGGLRQPASSTLRAADLTDVAKRLFEAYVETFHQAPEAEFLLKRYFFDRYFEKKYLQDNIFFIPRADFLWFFKYFVNDEKEERTIELKKRSTEKAETAIEIASIHIRGYYTYGKGACEINYTRTDEGRAGEARILKNTKEAIKHVSQLLVDFHNDRVMSHPY